MSFEQVAPGRFRLRIRFFPGDPEFVLGCREALASIPEGAELELDLRGNAGGSAFGDIAGLLLPKGAVTSRHRGRRAGGGFTPWCVLRNEHKPIYMGPLTVRMDKLCGSATEGLIGALKAAGRAKLVGRRSGGGTGFPRIYLSAGGVSFTCSS
jgi:C-terminal processing protease CtpA/Prc